MINEAILEGFLHAKESRAEGARMGKEDGILIEWDPELGSGTGNCVDCGKKGMVPAKCIECDAYIVPHVTTQKDVLCPNLIARLRQKEATDSMVANAKRVAKSKDSWFVNVFSPENHTSERMMRWFRSKPMGLGYLIFIREGDFNSIKESSSEDYEFIRLLTQPP